jgi:hypothetical protein
MQFQFFVVSFGPLMALSAAGAISELANKLT